VDLLKEKGYSEEDLFKQKWFIRWGFYLSLTILILMSANLGAGEFIYFQF